MSEAKFTPGPWEFVADAADGKHAIYGTGEADGYRIATVHNFNGRPMNKANARLIAAAPELLEACEEALGALNGAEHALPGYVVAALERAIAKATGEQQ